MRAFVAIFPPPDVQRAMHLSLPGQQTLQDFRLTKPENIHLTLKFLGEVPDDTAETISPTLKQAVELHDSFSLHPTGLGGFPSSEKARILWMGVAGDVGALVALQESVETAVGEAGFPKDGRDFVPHFTVGRSRRPGRIPRLDVSLPGRFEVREVLLVRSVASVEGVNYDPLESYWLRREGGAAS